MRHQSIPIVHAALELMQLPIPPYLPSDVEEAFQLEIEVTGTPIATKFGTMAGFSNTQSVNLGYLHLPLALEPLEKSVRTYKLRRTIHMMDGSQQPLASAAAIKAQGKEKIDCEIVVMIGVHVLEEPVDDRSWESEVLFEGHLTVMTRGLRMAVSDYFPFFSSCMLVCYYD